MNGFIVIAIVGVIVLAAVALLGAARRRDTGEAVGSLANETLKRDRQARKVAEAEAEQSMKSMCPTLPMNGVSLRHSSVSSCSWDGLT